MNQTWTKYLPSFLQQKLEGRHVLQRAVGNTGWLFADQIVRMVVGLFVGVWVARYLGPERYGLLSYSVAFVMLFSALASLGLNDIAVRNLVRTPALKNEIIGTAFLLRIMSGLTVFGLTMGGIFIIRPADTLTHWLVGIIAAGSVFQAFDAINFWFQSQVSSKYTVFATNFAFLMVSAVKIVLILRNAPLVAFAWAALAEIAIGSTGLVIAYRVTGHRLKDWHASLTMAGTLLKDSWPLIFSGIVSMIYLRIDQVMLGQMKGSGEVGIYSAAVRLAEVWYFIPMAIYSSVLPGIVEAKFISEDLFYSHLQKLYNLMAMIAYLIAIPVTFLAGWVVVILFGTSYAKAGPMLAVLIWAGLFVNLGVARSAFLNTMNWTRVHFITVFLGSIVNVGLNLLLIPVYGGMGAVIASCAAYWFAAHGACFVYKPLHKTGWMLTRAMVYPRVW
jgi:O-antigen/teichoic acid export membrane protein